MKDPARTMAPPSSESPMTEDPSRLSRQVTRLRVRNAHVLRGKVFSVFLRQDLGAKRGREVDKRGSFCEG